MTEKLARFMLGVNASVEEREPHEREQYLGAMIAGAMVRKMKALRHGDVRGLYDWNSAENYLRFKLSALQEERVKAREREDA